MIPDQSFNTANADMFSLAEPLLDISQAIPACRLMRA
jgi:hypothetical protein